MLPHASLFAKPKILTLTLDRSEFNGGEEAFEFGTERIRRLLRLKGFRKAFKVLAFHTKAPEWPHWHVIVDVGDPGGWVDLKGIWRLWRDVWRCGGFDLQLARKVGQDAVSAFRYALSYCQHQSSVETEWLRERTRLPRAWEVYGELRNALRTAEENGGAISERVGDYVDSSDVAEHPSGAERKRRKSRSVGERMDECDETCTVLVRRSGPDGGCSFGFVGTLPVTPGRLAYAATFDELPSFGLRVIRSDYPDGSSALDVELPLAGQKPRAVVDRLLQATFILRSDGDG